MFKSHLSSSLFKNFASDYQTINKKDSTNTYVFVSHDGTVKYLANLANDFRGNGSFFAVSVADDGFVEFLTFSE